VQYIVASMHGRMCVYKHVCCLHRLLLSHMQSNK
jgi:hypothetical protein